MWGRTREKGRGGENEEDYGRAKYNAGRNKGTGGNSNMEKMESYKYMLRQLKHHI